MRLVIKDKDSNEEVEGILVKKDSSFISIKIESAKVRIFHWEKVASIFRVYKKDKVEVNIESLKKGRE